MLKIVFYLAIFIIASYLLFVGWDISILIDGEISPLEIKKINSMEKFSLWSLFFLGGAHLSFLYPFMDTIKEYPKFGLMSLVLSVTLGIYFLVGIFPPEIKSWSFYVIFFSFLFVAICCIQIKEKITKKSE